MNRTCKELSNTVMLIALCAGLGASACQPSAQKEHPPQAKGQQALIIDGVWVPDEYPVNQHLSAPFIPQPVHACAEVVLVQGTLENAIVTVYDDQGQVLGTATADGDDVDVTLSRALLDGEYIFATQSVGQTVSLPSARRLIAAFSGPLPPPFLKENIWTCGRHITVDGTVPGANVVLSRLGSTIISQKTARTSVAPFLFYPIKQSWANDFVQAHQVMCPQGDSIVSDPSNEQVINSAPSPMPPPVISGAQVGSRRMGPNSFVGAHVKAFDRGNLLDDIYYVRPRNRFILDSPIQPDWEITVTHELCEESEPVQIPLLPIEVLEEKLAKNPPKVLGPICPGATQVRVRPGVNEGRIILKNGGSYVSQAEAGSGVTYMSLAQPVQTGEVLTAFHILQGNPDLIGATSAGETVSAGRELTVLGAKSLVDQDTGQPFSAFVKEENDFPRFDMVDCNCQEPGQGPSTLNGQIKIAGNSGTYATIKLYKQYDGYYNGHWNWLVGNPPVDDLKTTYELIADSPCGGQKLTKQFVLVSNKVDTSDGTAPSLTLQVDGQTVTGPSLSLNKDDVTIKATVTDPQGAQSVVIAEGGTTRTQKIAQPVAPIPGELNTSYTLELLPLTPVTVNATGANFANTQASQSVTITREMPTPSITTVPGPMFSRKSTGGANTFDITGKNLHFSNLTTTVTLTSTTNPSLSGTIQIAGSANNGHTSTKLSNLSWPMALWGNYGSYDVSISLSSPGGMVSAASNTKQMDLKDRRGPFTKYEIDDFTNNTRSCSGGSGSKIVGVTIGLQSGSNTHSATFESDTGVFFNDSYNSYDLPDNVNVGGVALSPDCKYGLILTKVGNNAVADGPFDVVFVYLDEDGDFQVTNSGSGILLWSYNIPSGANDPLGTTVQMFSTLVSEDRTILVFNSSDTFASELNITVNSSVFDALKNISLTTGRNADCPSLGNCNVSASISNGRRVDVELNGNAMYDEKID